LRIGNERLTAFRRPFHRQPELARGVAGQHVLRIEEQFHPEAVADVEYVNYAAKPQIMDYKSYAVRIDEAFRFNPEDTLIFRVTLTNATAQALQYKPDGFSLRVGERLYPQSISDANGTIPPNGTVPAYFAVTGTPDGGRNDISLKNDFTVILDAFPIAAATNNPVAPTNAVESDEDLTP